MKKGKFAFSLNIFISLFLFVTVIFPIFKLFLNVDFSNFGSVISSLQFKESFYNSVIVTSLSTAISVFIGYLLAYVINRTNIKHKELLTVLFSIPMLIPSISHGLGLINLFGTNGLINHVFNTNFNILGFNGIVLGSVMYSFPIAFLMISDGFKYIDNSIYDSAEVLGLNKFQIFQKVTFQYMKKPLFSSIFAVFTLIFTDYGIPLVIGARYTTLPVFLYREVIGLLDFSKGTIIGLFLLIPAFVSFIFDLLTKDVNNNYESKKFVIKNNNKRDLIFKIISFIIIFFEVIILLSFITLSFVKDYPYDMTFSLDHFKYVFSGDATNYLQNSLIIALITSIVGTIIAYFAAYLTARVKGKLSNIINFLAISSLAIPGIVLGISYTMAFKGTFIYNTIWILALVNVIHFFSSPYLLAYNALGKLNKNFEIVGKTCGINSFRIIKDVIIPNTLDTISEMFSYFFINSMITISAVTFLFNIKTMPLSLLINQYEGQMMLEESAIISLIILLINCLLKVLVYLFKKRNKKGVLLCN